MKKNVLQIGSNGMYILLFIAIMVINFAIAPLSYKLDLSKGRAHTLSDSSKQILRNLKNNATITFFVSESLPSRLIPLKREVDDVLNEYKRESGGKIIVEKVDPKNDQKKQVVAQQFGISPMRFSQQESDNFAISTSYFGLGITYGGKKASIAQATGVSDLEYNITSSIYKLGVQKLPIVGLMGTEGIENQLGTFAQAAASQFQLAPVSTPSAEVKTLVVFEGSEGYGQEQLDNIESYLNGGGKAVMFADGVKVLEDGSLSATKSKSTLSDLLAKHGIGLNEDLVLSAAAEFVNFAPPGSQTQLMVPYPFWMRTNSFDKNSPFFSNVNQLSFPWTSSTKLRSNASALVKSNPQSWHIDKEFSLDPEQIKQPSANQINQFNLIARSKGKNNSDLIFIPSSRFLFDRFMSGESSNLEFILNVLSEFASGGALAGIRSRAVNYYLIPTMDASQKNIFKYANILVLPGIFTALFAYRLYKRNRQSSNNS